MKLQLFNVSPSIPPELKFLESLSHNMWWCWHSDAIDIFRRISPELWRESGHNPLRFLSQVPLKRYEALLKDQGYMEHLQRVEAQFAEATAPVAGRYQDMTPCIAYFSLEYGIHESFRNYSGGLGVLAGDHVKAASDLAVPLVAVGLFYRQGYFRQYLDENGSQQEHFPENEIDQLPMQRACDAEGKPVQISLPMPQGHLLADVWRMEIGRVPLYLLDANIPENTPEYRAVTDRLYGGDRTTRLRQELLLAIGGTWALRALGHDPHVSHTNEGHAAFLSLARISHLMQAQELDLDAAMEVVYRSNVFTTHTPVPAGNEMFKVELARPYLQALENDLHIPADTAIAWGQSAVDKEHGDLSMTVLGLRLAACSNGVSELHGHVARRMWSRLWPDKPHDEVPIGHITNGVHVASWLQRDVEGIFDRYLGSGWKQHPASPQVLQQIHDLPEDELWRAHELGRSRLIRIVREQVERQSRARSAPRSQIAQAKSVLDHDALTIGFARRFATYKRANLLLHDPDRFEAILANEERPVQFIFAGKAHPDDEGGKELIRRLVHFARRPRVYRHIVFLEDYDMHLARALVQGVDVWLNTPRRPNEASGTSGMKVGINGGLNLSTMDGWWCEGYTPERGWAIGKGETYDDPDYGDSVEAQALYNLLEDEVIPTFYDRSGGDIPSNWVRMMKESIAMTLGLFTSHRMLAEYNSRYYEPALAAFRRLTDGAGQRASQLVVQRRRLEEHWSKVRVGSPTTDMEGETMHVGERFRVQTTVALGALKPDEVNVQVYFGRVDSRNEINRSHVQTMNMAEDRGKGVYLYTCEVQCRHSGRYGFTCRAMPSGDDWKDVMPGFITWAKGE